MKKKKKPISSKRDSKRKGSIIEVIKSILVRVTQLSYNNNNNNNNNKVIMKLLTLSD